MKKVLCFISVIFVISLFFVNVFALDKNIDNEVSSSSVVCLDSSDIENYSQEEKDKIESAWKKAMQQTTNKKQSQSGELEVVGTLGGRPLYAKTEVSEENNKK